MIKLFGSYPSRSNRVQWALEELEIPYQFYRIDFTSGDATSEAFLKLNPGGKVPVLKDDNLVLAESGAICNYLGDRNPDSGLTPAAGSVERAIYDQWMFFVQSELEQPMWTKAKHKFALPKAQRVEGINPTTEWEFDRAANVLLQNLGDRETILPGGFTMADIMIAHTLGWARIARFKLHPQLEQYFKLHSSRPAVARMADKEQLPLSEGL